MARKRWQEASQSLPALRLLSLIDLDAVAATVHYKHSSVIVQPDGCGAPEVFLDAGGFVSRVIDGR